MWWKLAALQHTALVEPTESVTIGDKGERFAQLDTVRDSVFVGQKCQTAPRTFCCGAQAGAPAATQD